MFDVGFWELILLGILGLLILGPEKLPRVAAQLGRWFGRARRLATNFQRELEREVALQNLDGAKERASEEVEAAAPPNEKSATDDG